MGPGILSCLGRSELFLKSQVGGLFGHGYHVQREHHG
jgi:hypothetical protein